MEDLSTTALMRSVADLCKTHYTEQ